MKRNGSRLVVGLLVASALAAAYVLGRSGESAVVAQTSPTGAVDDRDVYYPGTEELAPDEMRVVALGTGMPSVRPKQAAACFLVELGNGDKFLFDLGSGCHERLAAQKIPYDYIDKVFIGHLHVDHMGDLPSFWLGGTVMNRLTPLRIWGPSGGTPELGTARAMDLMEEMYAWDIRTRSGVIDFRGGVLEVNEFAFDGVNAVIFNENGVVIRSIPAVHGLDGAVSFILEWNGLTFVYGSDTVPNKWYVEYATDADLAIHEAFMVADTMMEKYGQPPQLAARINLTFHTSAQAFGKIMSTVRPRHAVAYHFFNDADTRYLVYEGIRESYEGPLSMGTDMMVWNITRDNVVERMAVSPDEAWDVSGPNRAPAPDRSRKSEYTSFTLDGKYDTSDVDSTWLIPFMKEHGLTEDDLKAGM